MRQKLRVTRRHQQGFSAAASDQLAPSPQLGIGDGPDEYIDGVVREIRRKDAYFVQQLRRYRAARLVILVSAALVPVLSTTASVPRAVLGALGALAAVTEGANQLFAWRDSATRAGAAGNALENETNLFLMSQPPYAGLARNLRFGLYVQRVEKTRMAGSSDFMRLWNQVTPAADPAGGATGHAEGAVSP